MLKGDVLLKKIWLALSLFLVGVVMAIDIDLHTTLKLDWDMVGVYALFVLVIVSLI